MVQTWCTTIAGVTQTLRALACTLTLSACASPTPGGTADSGARDAPIELAPVDVPAVDIPPPPPPMAEPGRHNVTVVETRRVVPSDGLPMETTPLVSNNNLDVIRHDGRVYMAWRTAPDHFASERTVMYVVSSADERTWRFETRVQAATDLREPRFLSLNGSLFLYIARLGTNSLSFDPQGISVTERRPDGRWTDPAPIYRPGFIAWRARTQRGTPYLTGYFGGEHIYRFDGLPLEVELLTTRDGRTLEAADPMHRVVSSGGGSETDFALGDDGTLFGVIRNEAGDETGFGSKVCRAQPGHIGEWNCRHDVRKYDSPLMFWHDGEAYLIARRNVTETGAYDLERRDLSQLRQALMYEVAFSNAPKRCSLWRYDQAGDRIVYMLDLPSRGDTCFASVIDTGPGEFAVYNYSSDIDGPDVNWNVGQLNPTFIYRSLLRFTRR